MPQQSRLSTGLSGVAGEYFVAAELSRRGYVATLTLKNTRGIDILAATIDGRKTACIQVKSKQGSRAKWLLSQRVETLDLADNLFFVFVCLNDLGVPDFYVVPLRHVVPKVKRDYEEWRATPGRGGRPHGESGVRQFRPDPEYHNAWDKLGLDSAV